MSDHPREVDPVTGYDTTGHEWNGIRELNTPFPRIVIWFLVLTIAYSVIAWILLPAWPTLSGHTRGLLGLDQGTMAHERLESVVRERNDWLESFADADFGGLQSDPDLLAKAFPAARRLFLDNCAACHGKDGRGGPGFPDLTDPDWLWGNEPEDIAETIRAGINSTHPDTRFAEMMAFGRMGMLTAEDLDRLADHVVALSAGNQEADPAAATLFEENCAACHGERGEGGLGVGAPSLIYGTPIYGRDRSTVRRTLHAGRAGVMPHWQDRLSDAEIHLLALYVARLGATDAKTLEAGK